ncbi:MAG: right-handed parallel beta-helix repeat-containing protein, partial [Acidobacteriaceae bacterium]
MHFAIARLRRVAGLVSLLAAIPCVASAATLCVTSHAHPGCYTSIQSAVSAAAKGDVIQVWPGVYKEDVTIGTSLSLLGSDNPGQTVIDATGLANGIFVDGLDNKGLANVTIAGFTVKNALYEGVVVVNASDVTVRNNHIVHNDQIGPVFGSGPACKGQAAYETDESGDCGGGLHLIGTSHSIVSGNLFTQDGDGVLISDDTGPSHDNLLIGNSAVDNPPECGIVLASHPPMGSTPPDYAKHYGVYHNTVAYNISDRNGVTVGGAGVGLFSDGEGQGRTSQNVIIGNELIGNGIPGVSLHSHVGPAFGLPDDDMNGNMIIGNYIAGNGADTADTATDGPAGINISSGQGGSPIYGTIITGNTITDEDEDIAADSPSEVDAHLNNLLGGKIGVANVCALDNGATSPLCTGSIDATQNFWGCPAGPGKGNCSTTSGANIVFNPWLWSPVP